MNLTGELGIHARLLASGNGVRLDGLEVMLYRPVVSRLFIAQPARTVLQLVPYLYTLCTHAQCAASRAVLTAVGVTGLPPEDDHRLWLELLHENFWRLLLDWPLALGLPQEREAFIAWRTRPRSRENDIAATRLLLAQTLDTLAERCLAALAARWYGDGEVAAIHAAATARFVPPALTPADWLPCWQGLTPDLPPLPPPASVVAAYCQRLAMTRHAAQALVAGAPFPVAAVHDGSGLAVSQVWTARGVLTHAVELMAVRMSGDIDLVRRYSVWAPTDRHFADSSALLHLLAAAPASGADSAEPLQQQLTQAILALDPCLPYTLEWNHA